jgi:hypothetical protein
MPVDPLPIKGPLPGFVLDRLPQGEPLKRMLGRANISRPDDYESILTKPCAMIAST